jgi:hypothetical protein
MRRTDLVRNLLRIYCVLSYVRRMQRSWLVAFGVVLTCASGCQFDNSGVAWDPNADAAPRPDAVDGDAAAGAIDATPGAIDATPGTPDGTPSPDGTPPDDDVCDDDDVVLCLRFDGNTNDSSESETDAVASNIAYANGVHGMAVVLTPSSLIDVAETDTLDNDEISIEAWVNRDPGEGGYIVDNDNQYGFSVSNTGTLGCLVVGQTTFPQTYGGTVTPNDWTHIACTYSSDDGLRIYVDGNQVGTDGDDGELRDLGSSGVAIGRDNPSGGTFEGSIDSLRIWSRQLSGNEICPQCP